MIPITVKFQQTIDIEAVVGRMSLAAYQNPLVQNDMGPKLRFNLKTPDGDPINVSGCDVRLFLRQSHRIGHINVGHESCSGVDLSQGVVVYDFQPGDLSGVGTYFGDLQIIYDNGVVETSFDPVRFIVRENNQ